MPTPSTPSLTLAAASATSFTATVTADVGSTTVLRYRRIGDTTDTVGPTITGSGAATITGLRTNASYLVWAVSSASGSLSLPAIAAVSLAQSDTVSGAIVAQWRLDPALVALCPQLWTDEIPEEDETGTAIAPPVACLEIPEEVPEWNFEADYHVVAQAKLTIYANTKAAADQIAAAFGVTMNWQALPFATVRSVQMMLTRSARGLEDVIDKDGNRVFYHTLEYQVMATRAG